MPIENFIVPHVKSWFIHIAVSIELDIFAVGNSHGKVKTDCFYAINFSFDLI